MKATIKQITLQNFKGCKDATYTFDGKDVNVCGANGSGKTTIFDAFTWLLFGKDSLDNAKFEVRPLDADGKQIDNVEICVSATLVIDGKEVELKKTQKQNWVKKRGSENPTLQGNVNSYEIDGYPRKDKEYTEYINGIVSDDLFKMLTNPAYFPNMPWKEQRATIMKFANGASDIELATGDSRFTELLPEIEKAPSIDDIKNKYQKSLTELKKKQVELPVRIDEVSKSKVDIDVAELELQRNLLKEQIAKNKSKQEDVSKQFDEYQKLSDGIMQLKFAESDLQRKANESNNHKKSELENAISEKKFLLKQAEKTIDDCERQIEDSKHHSVVLSESIESYRSQYKHAQSLAFDENSLVCSYCGQEYPEDKKEQIKAEFESKKATEIKKITELGNETKVKLDAEKEIEQKKLEAKESVRREIIDVALLASSELLSRNISSSDNKKIVEDFIEEING